MAIKVKLRKKVITGDRHTLYLDFYPEVIHPKTGKPTRREFLGMYLFAPIKIIKHKTIGGKIKETYIFSDNLVQNESCKKHNDDTMQIAEQIRQQRENSFNKPEIYSGFEKELLKIKERGEQNFVTYFKQLTDNRKFSTHENWISTSKYLENYSGGFVRFADLNETYCNGFKEYLLTTKSNKSSKVSLSQNSAQSYFNKFKAALRQAYKDGFLQFDINTRIDPIKQADTQRNFLNLEELNSLARTHCTNPVLKRAALFSSLTGLRFSDIQKLIWNEVEFAKGQGHTIRFKQRKTKGEETLPISEQAFNLMGEMREPSETVFAGLEYADTQKTDLGQWLGAAGITKKITFHCFRHTYATLQLNNGTDIYTVSKMLGHRELKTTQIYAKIVDKTKRDATEKIILDF
jgi:integrase